MGRTAPGPLVLHRLLTCLRAAGPFYYAHEEYQQYLARPGSRQYCSAQPQGVELAAFETWAPAELATKHAPKLPRPYWDKHGPKPGCTIKGAVAQVKWPPE